MTTSARASSAGTGETSRSRAKSDRRSQIIAAAERLIAERGYLSVR
ncbi:MAG: TetR/AcrR family transcriptional regulator, partial [Mycolicibacterium sp.]|nr:TetR/AcrR family transcriptional regulator [Mycolicibacterium sp.]